MAALFYLRNIPLYHIFAEQYSKTDFSTVGMYYFGYKLSRVMSAQFYFLSFL